MEAQALINQVTRQELYKHLPTEGLAPEVAELLEVISSSLQCSKDMVLTAALVVVGTAAGKNIKVCDGKFSNHLALWYAPVARSGSNKSTPLKLIQLPLREKNKENYLNFKQEMDIWKSVKENPDPKPIWQQLIMTNSTTEARLQTLANNDCGLLIASDEIKSFLDNLNKYSKGGDVSELLSLFDGEDLTINRKSEEAVLIETPFMSIMGSIQPSVLASTFGSDLLMCNGFNQRWLFTYQEDEVIPEYSERTIDTHYLNYWCSLINNYYVCSVKLLRLADNNVSTCRRRRTSSQAQRTLVIVPSSKRT